MAKSTASQRVHGLKQRVYPFKNPIAWLQAFWQFSRPHTIVGTSFSTVALLAIALAAVELDSAVWLVALSSWLVAWIACLCGNVYIVGLNQVEDIAIDRINKPHLPIASGEFSKRHAQGLVALMGIGAIALALISQNIYLMLTIVLSLIIGTAYSLPPVRLKRYPFWASMCILVVRGAIVNLGLYLYFSTQLGLGMTVPARVWALMLFILVFSFVIAIFKDIPDMEGDRQFNISTYTLQLGQKKVFNLARWVLTVCYGGLILAGPFLPGVNAPFLIVTHSLGILVFWWLSRRVDLDTTPIKKDISYPDFYQFIWKLFFVEYLIFPLACWLSK
ncbi:MAG: homogentisate phytyltransferase [Cyanobacteria bacterium J06632_3]